MSHTFGDFLTPSGFAGPQGLSALSREGSVVLEGLRFSSRYLAVRRQQAALPYAGPHRRTPHDPVLLVPGFMAGDYTLRGLSRLLRAEGFRTYRSEIVLNAGCTREAGEALERRVEAIALRRGRPVTLVGHSLGGMLARAVAGRRPDLIDSLVTMGSPVLAPAAVHRLLAWDARLLARLAAAGIGGAMSADCLAGDCARLAYEELQAPLPEGFGFTAIYSRRDGIVDWRACLDPLAEHVEVGTSHCGMALDPKVVDHVLHALRVQQARRADAAYAARPDEVSATRGGGTASPGTAPSAPGVVPLAAGT